MRDEWYNLLGSSPGGAGSIGRATVSVGSVQTPSGLKITLPVKVKTIDNTTGLSAYDLRITFDPKVLRVESVGPGFEPLGNPKAYRVDNAKGILYLNGYHSSSRVITGDIGIASLNIRIIGATGSSSPVTVKAITLSDILGNNIPATEIAGAITVK